MDTMNGRPDFWCSSTSVREMLDTTIRVKDGPPSVCLVGGTRPEGLKLAPVAVAMREGARLSPVIISSGQHPTMFHQALEGFQLRPDVSVELTRRDGGQVELTSLLLSELDRVFRDCQPDAVVVQGDTTTALAAALAAFWQAIPIVHLEAGLRSGDLSAPFPEEANRKLVGQIASLHLAPTPAAARNLGRDGISGPHVLTIGNTIVDAALGLCRQHGVFSCTELDAVERRVAGGKRRLVLATVHRRESWGAPLGRVLSAVAELVRTVADLEVVLPAHPNPQVRDQVVAHLGRLDRVTVTEPLPYVDLVRLMRRATLVISDSGGIQEEVASFGVPVLVLREVTERAEAVQAGIARLVGTNKRAILDAARHVLALTADGRRWPCAGNPFGDGMARYRAEQAIAWRLGLAGRPPAPFTPPSSVHQERMVSR